MNIRMLLWWVGFIICALLIQRIFPGVDALAPGLLIALQRKHIPTIAALFLLFSLIQEGANALLFGTSFLWYGGIIIFFQLLVRIFGPRNLLFVCMFSICIGTFHSCLLWFISTLQDVPVNFQRIFYLGVIQMFAIPLLWQFASMTFPKEAQHGN